MAVMCNMTPEERKYWSGRFPTLLTDEQQEAAKGAFTRYIFYETWGRRDFREFWCWNCGRFEAHRTEYGEYIFPPHSYKHGDTGECPRCGHQGEYRALGRYRNMKSLKEWQNVGFIWEEDGALLMSAGNAVRDYSFDDLAPLPEYYEKARYVVMPGKRMKWKRIRCWDGWYETYGIEEAKTFTEPFPRSHWEGSSFRPGEVFWVGSENIDVSDLRYCEAENFIREYWGVNRSPDTGELEAFRGLVLYLGEYSRRPQLEMLYKLGHGDVINALIEDGAVNSTVVNWRAKTPAAFFRMSKADYRCFSEKKGKYKDLVEWRRRMGSMEGMSFEEYFACCAWLPKSAGEFFAAAERHGVAPKKLWAYLQEQAPIGDFGDATFRMWKDYLEMAAQLERDLTFRRNLLPQDLRREHDAADDLLAGVEESAQDHSKGKYGKRFMKLKRMYAYSDGELQIVIPVNKQDIQLEGKRLKHCVGGYADRHIAGKTTILFLRETERPKHRYVTIEINDATHNIVQAHGYRNDLGTDSPLWRHREFFDEWLDWVRRGSPRYKNGKPVRRHKKQEVRTA